MVCRPLSEVILRIFIVSFILAIYTTYWRTDTLLPVVMPMGGLKLEKFYEK